MALNHCDSAQRASAPQHGATPTPPQVSTAATRVALKGQHRPALWNPFRVRVQTGYQPGAAFIRIRGFSCPSLICASLSGSVAALTSSINANILNAQMSPRTSFVDEPNVALDLCLSTDQSGSLVTISDKRGGPHGWWERTVSVEGGRYYRFSAVLTCTSSPDWWNGMNIACPTWQS